MSTDKKKCPHCQHGRQTSTYAPAYNCEDCGGTGELWFCEYCEQWLDPGAFNGPDTPLCARCEDEGLHLRYWSEGMSVFDRDTGGDMIASTFVKPCLEKDWKQAYKEACELAAKIAELLNDAE